MSSRVTLADVAQRAGVSTQTVSRVVNHNPAVRPETRARVLEVIGELGYRPNTVARSLATRRTMTFGIVVPDIGNPYFADVVRGAEDAARGLGYQILLCNTDQMPERELTAIEAFQEKQVDGIILCSTRIPEEDLPDTLRTHTPIVLTGREWVEGAVGAVHADDDRGLLLAIKHLLQRERRNIVFAAGRPGGPGHARRMRAWHEFADSAGYCAEQLVAIPCATNPAGGQEAASQALRDNPEVDGIVCFNDLVAIGAVHACIEAGKRVPEDVAVVGMTDIALASLVEPPLTTVGHAKHELGKQAVAMLVDHLASRAHEREIVLKTELVVRASAP